MNKTRIAMLVSVATLIGSLVAIILKQDLGIQTTLYILLAGLSIICLVYSVYIDLRSYIDILLKPIYGRYGITTFNQNPEITDDQITEEIERHMDDHRH